MKNQICPFSKLFIFFSWIVTLLSFSSCGPGIPLTPAIPSTNYLSNDNLNQTVSLSSPTLNYVNSSVESVNFTLTLSKSLHFPLSLNQVILVKMGSADCAVSITGGNTEYLITLSSFTGNGILALNIVLGNTTYTFEPKIVTVDNVNPLKTNTVTIPSSPIASSSANFSWSNVEDTGTIYYQFKLCSDSNCSSDCTDAEDIDETEITVNNLIDGTTLYACVQTVDLAGNLSGFKSSNSSFQVDLSPLSLLSNMISLSSPSSGVTSSDTTPTITGSGLEPSTTFTLYEDSGCTSSLGSMTVTAEGEINFNSLTLTDDGSIHFYGKLSLDSEETACIDLEKHYQLDSTPPAYGSLSNLVLSSPSNGVTSSDLSPVITGNGTTGDTISLFNEGSCTAEIGNGTVSGGSFTINITPYNNLVDDGNIHFYAKLSDPLGNESTCFDLSLSYQLDTTPPSNPSVWSLSTPTDGSTSNDTTPSITKSGLIGEDGSSIFIYDDASCTTAIGTSIVSGGSFTVSDIGYLNDGSDEGIKTFYGMVTDIAGNSSSCVSLNLSYLLDTNAPTDPSGWSITSPAIGVTSNDITPVIEGIGLSGENGGTVTLFDSAGCSGGSIGSATISGEVFTVNNISYQSDGSDDGTLSFYGLITDVAGNSSNCVNLNLGYKLDTTAPSDPTGFTMSSPNNGATSSDITPQISGSGLNSENGSTVSIYDSAGCGSAIGTATIAGGSVTVSNITYLNDGTQDGSKSFYGKITDISENSSSCVALSISYKLDTTAPTNPSGWTMSSPGSGTTSNDETPQFVGAGLALENGGTVALYDDVSCVDVIGSATIAGGGFTASNITYATDGSDDGAKTFYGKTIDIAGNSSSCVSLDLGYLFDHTVPNDPSSWTMSSPASGSTSSDSSPVINGSSLEGENGGEVTIYGTVACDTPLGTATISSGSFSVTNISYLTDGSEDGTKSFYGKIVDAGGNESSCIALSLGYLLDTTDPADPSGWTISSPNMGTTSNDITPQIGGAGLAVENGSLVEIFDNGACLSSIGSATISGGSFTVSNITYLNNGTQDGTKAFYGKITDVSGNSSACVDLTLEYLLDTTPPANPSGWAMSSPSSGTTSNDVTPEISRAGLASENGASISIYDSSGCAVPVGSAVIAGGSFTVSDISYLNDGSDDGTISFYGKITDVGGNNSSCINLSLGYKLDTIVPSDPVGWSFTNVVNGDTSGNFTPQITGAGLSAENKSIVNIYLTGACGTSVGSATINAGVFTVTNITFADDGSGDGIKTFYGTITDAGGNISTCTDLLLSYELNTSIPSVTISVPTSSDYINNANKGAFTISGECSEDGRAVTVNATGGLSATPNCTGTSWTTNLDFSGVANGPITITADHDNVALTPAPQASVTLTKDSAIPADPSGWTLGSPADGATSSDYTPQISGGGLVAENGASIDIYTAVGCITSVGTSEVSGGTFTVSNLSFASDGSADGTKNFYGKITDVAGNASSCVDLTQSYLLDTTTPSNPSSWSLASPNNGTTSNDVTPQISKIGLVGEDGSSITIYDAIACSDNIGSAVIAGGDFTVSNITYQNDGSDDGPKSFYGKIVDTAGNSSSCVSLNLGYKVDTIDPSDPTGWTLSSPSNGATSSDYTPQIAGLSSENGGSVTLYNALACAVSVGTATIAGGTFTVSNISYVNDGSADGTKTFYGKITDTGGNESNCIALSLNYLLDTVVPSNPSGWTMSSPNTGATSSDTTPQITGSGLVAENGSSVTIHATGACASAIGSATIAGGTFTVLNINYLNNGTQDGTKTYYGLITDIAGNNSACTDLSLGYLLDTTVPANPSGWTMASPNTGTTSNDYTPQISGSGLASENGGSVIISNSADCSSTVGSAVIAGGIFTVSNITYASDGSADGTKAFYGKIIDVGGNSSTCVSLNLSYLLDTLSPSNPSGWTMASPNTGTTSSDYTPQISGSGLSAENGSSISISNASDCSSPVGSAVIAGGVFTVSNISYATDGSADGQKNFYGKITDSAGNSSLCSNLSLTYTLDRTAPTNPTGWSMSSPNTGTTSNDYTPQISSSGLASENGSTVTIYDAGACSSSIGTATISGGSFTVSNIAYASNGTQDGTKTFYGKIVDLAGNSSGCITLNLGYLLDTTAPANPSGWTMSSPNTGTTSNDNTPQVAGSGLSAENGGSVIISNVVGCGSSVGSATISSGGFTVSNISYSTDGSADGTKTFYGMIIDAGGNSSSCVSLSLSYLFDKTLPTVSITTPISSDIINSSNMSNITVSGSCSENGRTVSISTTGDLSATPTCNSGSWTTNLNFSNHSEGVVTLDATISDIAGNSATSSVNLSKFVRSIAQSIATGYYGSCVVLETGNIKCWGLNTSGQLGLGSTDNKGDSAGEMGNNLSVTLLGSSRNILKFNLGYAHTCALLDNSSVKCWGSNLYGQLGQGHTNNLGSLSNEMGDNLSTISLSSNNIVINISNKGNFNCALFDDLSVKCWGANTYGQLGLGHSNALGDNINEMGNNLSSILLGTGRKAMAISVGSFQSCALLDNVTIKCWGYNQYGELGQGHTDNLGDSINEMGNNLSTISLGSNLWPISITTALNYTCALLNDSSIKCWGRNDSGQLGQGTTADIGTSTNQMGDNLSKINIGTNKKALVLSSGEHTCALLDDQTVKCWGKNNYGQLGKNNTASIGNTPNGMGDNLSSLNLGQNKKVYDIKANISSTCALLNDGTVKCWGLNNYGQLGQGHTNPLGDNTNEMGDNLSNIIFKSPANAIRSVYTAKSGYHNCVIQDDFTIKCWGRNSAGNLGMGNISSYGDNANEMGLNLSTINLGTNKKIFNLGLGYSHTCATLDDGTLKCFGSNVNGELGLGHTDNLGDNVDEMGNNLSTINLGQNRKSLLAIGGAYHSCSLLDNFSIKCWGRSSNGQLAQGNTVSLGNEANEMGDNLSSVSLGTNAIPIALAVGSYGNCALLSNATVKCWGYNNYGQLGQGTVQTLGDNAGEMGDNLSTIQLGTNIRALGISTSYLNTCVILENGAIKCWGINSSGQLGLGHTDNLGNEPNEMGNNLSSISLGSNRKAISMILGMYNVCAILDNSTLKCWGINSSGQLGQGHTNNLGDGANEMGDNLSIINLGLNRKVVSFSFGYSICALLDNSTVKCWGPNSNGELGQGHSNKIGDDPNEMGDNLSSIIFY